MSHSNIIKLFQIIWKLWLAQDLSFRRDKYITKSESCLSCTLYAYCTLSMPLPDTFKIFQTISKLWSAQKFSLEMYSGEITGKKKKA